MNCEGYFLRFFSIECATYDGSGSSFVTDKPGSRTVDRIANPNEPAQNTTAPGKQARVGGSTGKTNQGHHYGQRGGRP